MKVIDLLNMISKGEEIPKKVKYSGIIFENKNGDLLNDMACSLFEHKGNGNEKLLPMINDEVEILEEDKKIEKIRQLCEYPNTDTYECWSVKEDILVDKINEIIDYIQSKGE